MLAPSLPEPLEDLCKGSVDAAILVAFALDVESRCVQPACAIEVGLNDCHMVVDHEQVVAQWFVISANLHSHARWRGELTDQLVGYGSNVDDRQGRQVAGALALFCLPVADGFPGRVQEEAAQLGSGFEQGALVVQDDSNDVGYQNFKMVPWSSVSAAFSPALLVDTTYGAPNPGLAAKPITRDLPPGRSQARDRHSSSTRPGTTSICVERGS